MLEKKIEKHAISVLVNDEPGALARVIGLFSGRGYNIDSLTVAPVNLEKKYSRIIIVTFGTKMIIEQIISSLARLIQVKKVIDLTSSNSSQEKELALIKINPKKGKKKEFLLLQKNLKQK